MNNLNPNAHIQTMERALIESIKSVQREINTCNEFLARLDYLGCDADGWSANTLKRWQLEKSVVHKELATLRERVKALQVKRATFKL